MCQASDHTPPGGVPSGLQRKALRPAGLGIKGGRRSSPWGRAILHEAIAAIEVDMLYALIAAAHRTGTSLPVPRATRLRGIRLTRNVIGRRTRARGVDEITARRLRGTGSATVGSPGVSSRRAIGWRRGVGWCPRSVPLAHITRVDV